jgi:hypothetical protein
VGIKVSAFANAFGKLDHDEEVRGCAYSFDYPNLWEQFVYELVTKAKG